MVVPVFIAAQTLQCKTGLKAAACTDGALVGTAATE